MSNDDGGGENDPLLNNDDDGVVSGEEQLHRRREIRSSERSDINNEYEDEYDGQPDENEYVDATQIGYRSVDEIVEDLGFGTFHWRLLILCGMGAFSIALTHAMKSFLMPILKDYWKLKHWHLAFMNSADLLGMIIGSVVLGRAADKVGRRPVYLMCLTFSGVFGFLSAFATNFGVFVVCRALLGVAFGAGIVINIVLLAEVLPVSNRGYYLAIVSVFHASGHLMCVALAWLLIPRSGWRFFVAITAIPPIVVPLFQYYIPESPRFALLQDSNDANTRCIELLTRIASDNNASDEVLDKISKSVLRRQNVESREAADLADYIRLFNHPMLGRITFMVAAIWFFQSVAGVVVVWLPLYVAENQKLHAINHGRMHMNKAYAAALLTGIGGLGGVAVFTRIMESFDRRTLLSWGYFAITVCAASLAFMHTATPILILLPFISGLEKGLLTTLNVFTPEVYPTAVRTSAMGLTNAFQRFGMAVGHWFVGGLMSKSFVLLACMIGGLYILSLILVLLLPFDTRGKKLASAYYSRLRKEKRWGCGRGCGF